MFKALVRAKKIYPMGRHLWQLRARKEPDFLELEDGQRVPGLYQYGRGDKAYFVSSKAEKIAQVKGNRAVNRVSGRLKKAKGQASRCFVKLSLAGKSKGISLLKVILLSPEDAQSQKPLCLFPARDGQMCTRCERNKLRVFV